MIRATAPKQVAEFYREVFELFEVKEPPLGDTVRLSDGKVRLLIQPTNDSSYLSMRQGLDHIGFKVESLEQAKQDLDELAAISPASATTPCGCKDRRRDRGDAHVRHPRPRRPLRRCGRGRQEEQRQMRGDRRAGGNGSRSRASRTSPTPTSAAPSTTTTTRFGSSSFPPGTPTRSPGGEGSPYSAGEGNLDRNSRAAC